MRRFLLSLFLCGVAFAVVCRQLKSSDLPLAYRDGSTSTCITLAEDIYWDAPNIFTAAITVSARTRITVNFAGHKIRSNPGSRVFLVRGVSSRITVTDLATLEATVQTRAEYTRAFQVDTAGSLYLNGPVVTFNYTTAVAIFDGFAEIADLQVYAHLMENEPRQQVVGVMTLGTGTATVGKLLTRIFNARGTPVQGQSWGFYAGPSVTGDGTTGAITLRNLDIMAHTPVDLHAFSSAGILDSRLISNSPGGGAGNGLVIGFLPLDARVGSFTGQNISIDTTAANRFRTSGLFIRSPASVTLTKLRIVGANERASCPLGLIHYEPVKTRNTLISTTQTISISDFVLTGTNPGTIAVDVMPNTFFENPYAINVRDTQPIIKLTGGIINGTGLVAVNTDTGADNVQLDTITIASGYWWGVRAAGGTTRLSIKHVGVTNACRGIELMPNRTFSGSTYVSRLNIVKKNTLTDCTQPIIDHAQQTDIDSTNVISGSSSKRTDCTAVPAVPDPIDLSLLPSRRQEAQVPFDPNLPQDETSPWRLMFI